MVYDASEGRGPSRWLGDPGGTLPTSLINRAQRRARLRESHVGPRQAPPAARGSVTPHPRHRGDGRRPWEGVRRPRHRVRFACGGSGGQPHSRCIYPCHPRRARILIPPVRHCCCPAVSASSAKTSSSTSLPTPTAGWRRFAVRLSTLGSQTSCEGCLRSTNTIWTVLYEESEVAKLRALYSTDPLFECSNVYITVESREKHLGNISTFSLTH